MDVNSLHDRPDASFKKVIDNLIQKLTEKQEQMQKSKRSFSFNLFRKKTPEEKLLAIVNKALNKLRKIEKDYIIKPQRTDLSK